MDRSGDSRRRGVTCALGAAVLFGMGTPAAKRLLPAIDAWLLAGILYLGSGLGLTVYHGVRRWTGVPRQETALCRGDWPWLVGAGVAGGMLGPLLLMLGLRLAPASSVSLLLNLEGVFTALLAWFVFRENFDARIAWGMVLILAGALAVSWQGGFGGGSGWGIGAVVAACFCWAVDNNLTRKVAGSDPVQIALLKGWCAGVANVGLGIGLGAKLPEFGVAGMAGVLGFLSYGVSLALFVIALRELGTARTGAYFSVAPFVGAAASVAVLREPLSTGLGLGAALMGWGVWLHLTERHEHAHVHEPLEHDHRHIHDEHHQHGHAPGDPPGEPHAHRHRHEAMIHSHPHYPDLHHRHRHE